MVVDIDYSSLTIIITVVVCSKVEIKICRIAEYILRGYCGRIWFYKEFDF